MAVREIKGWADVTVLPGQSDYVRRVLNLRGTIVPMVDLRCRFGNGRTEATPSHVVIIVQVKEKMAELFADRVLDIVPLDGASIKAVPRIAQSAHANVLLGLVTADAGMIALIDLLALLFAHTKGDLSDQNFVTA